MQLGFLHNSLIRGTCFFQRHGTNQLLVFRTLLIRSRYFSFSIRHTHFLRLQISCTPSLGHCKTSTAGTYSLFKNFLNIPIGNFSLPICLRMVSQTHYVFDSIPAHEFLKHFVCKMAPQTSKRCTTKIPCKGHFMSSDDISYSLALITKFNPLKTIFKNGRPIKT